MHEVKVEVVGTLDRREDTVAIVVRRSKAEEFNKHEVRAIGNVLKEAFGDKVLVIILGPNDHVETLSEGEMSDRGWVRGIASDRSRLTSVH